jgi:uncharacterized phage-like protein YoqJ
VDLLGQRAVLEAHEGQSLAFTGHRPDKVAQYEGVVRLHILCTLLTMKPREVISGMALGVDTWVADAALGLGIPLVAAVPFAKQDAKWSSADRKRYRALLWKAAIVCVVSEASSYHPSQMQARNEWMVDRCGLLVAYWNGSTGGTSNCVAYARRKGRAHVLVDPTILR